MNANTAAKSITGLAETREQIVARYTDLASRQPFIQGWGDLEPGMVVVIDRGSYSGGYRRGYHLGIVTKANKQRVTVLNEFRESAEFAVTSGKQWGRYAYASIARVYSSQPHLMTVAELEERRAAEQAEEDRRRRLRDLNNRANTTLDEFLKAGDGASADDLTALEAMLEELERRVDERREASRKQMESWKQW